MGYLPWAGVFVGVLLVLSGDAMSSVWARQQRPWQAARATLLWATGSMAYFPAIKRYGMAGPVTIGTLCTAVGVVLVAILIGEPVSLRKGFGFALALFAIWLLSE